jgi:hypothetical protein
MNYYYLAASLPTLSLDSAPLISPDAFRVLCRQHLTPADREAMEEVLDFDPAGAAPRGAVAREWFAAETCLRNAIVRVRAARLQRDAAASLRPESGYESTAERAVSEAYARGTPAERELALDRHRWHTLEALAGFDPFALRALMAYGLKLKLADRWARLTEEQGMRAADAIVNAVAAA